MIEESFDRHLIELFAFKATLPLFKRHCFISRLLRGYVPMISPP